MANPIHPRRSLHRAITGRQAGIACFASLLALPIAVQAQAGVAGAARPGSASVLAKAGSSVALFSPLADRSNPVGG